MSGLWQTVEAAFQRLESRQGFSQRPLQRRMAQFVCEQLEFGRSVMVEAPTGVGKSLAVLLPAIAYALQRDKRVVISTYTVLLAEQYWRKDLPLALELFPSRPSVALAMGRSRYACKDIICDSEQGSLFADSAELLRYWVNTAQEGLESEFNAFLRQREMPSLQIQNLFQNLWTHIAVPSACRARLCKKYDECFYYQARERSRQAEIVITTHALVLADALVREVTNGAASLLDDYDYLILDEAQDFLAAAASALEFDLDQQLIRRLTAHAWTLFHQMTRLFEDEPRTERFINSVKELVNRFADRLNEAYNQMVFSNGVPPEGMATRVAPETLAQMSALRGSYCPDLHLQVVRTATAFREAILDFHNQLIHTILESEEDLTDLQRNSIDKLLEEFQPQFLATQANLERLKDPPEIGVSWVERTDSHWKACYKPVVLADWLRVHVWRHRPAMLVSATLAVDGQFDFFAEQLGFEPQVVLQLPPVFDYGRQCALYMPPVGTIPDPPVKTLSPGAGAYYQRVADEVAALVRLTRGRALVLFSSSHEMREVYQRVRLDGIPILIQGEGSVADLARRFREDVHAVLFGVRSFWTGFDAPGETLVNLILVRIPFEVPTTPSQRARQAWFEARGLNAFDEWALPLVKLQMRQGVGRLMRRADDWGTVAILDPRMRTKSYGAEILRNLPPGMPTFDTHSALANWLRHHTDLT